MAQDQQARVSAYTHKMQAELRHLRERGVRMVGNAFSSVLLLKGRPGQAELAGGPLFSGADGKALRAALLKLGYAPEDWMGAATWTDGYAPVSPTLLRQVVTAMDPATLVMCDEESAVCVRDAFADDLFAVQDLSKAMLAPGEVVDVGGIRMLNLGGFEDALSDNHQKQVMWARLKQIPPLGEPY